MTTEQKINELINYLEEPKFSNGTLRDFQNCFNDAVDIIKDVNDKCSDMQIEINDVKERVTILEQ